MREVPLQVVLAQLNPRLRLAAQLKGVPTCGRGKVWGQGYTEREEGRGDTGSGDTVPCRLPIVILPKSRPLQGYLAHENPPPPQDYPRPLGTGLLSGPSRTRFLMSKVPL